MSKFKLLAPQMITVAIFSGCYGIFAFTNLDFNLINFSKEVRFLIIVPTVISFFVCAFIAAQKEVLKKNQVVK